MSSSGGNSGSTTTTQELPSWAQPAAQQLLTNGQNLSTQAIPQYTGQMVAGLNNTETGAIGQAANTATTGQGLTGTATNYEAGLQSNPNGFQTSSAYTGNNTASNVANPFTSLSNNSSLTAAENSADQALTQNYSQVTNPTTLAQFRNGGAFGGSAMNQATNNNEYQLANAIGNTNAGIANNAYNTAAGVASNEAAQQNQVAEQNQYTGTAAGEAENALNESAYNSQQQNILGAENTANNTNAASGTEATNALNAGDASQQNSQDTLDALYQQWYNQANAPYEQQSILSSALSGALGSGAGTSISSSTAGTGSTLGTALGLGLTGLGAYNQWG